MDVECRVVEAGGSHGTRGVGGSESFVSTIVRFFVSDSGGRARDRDQRMWAIWAVRQDAGSG